MDKSEKLRMDFLALTEGQSIDELIPMISTMLATIAVRGMVPKQMILAYIIDQIECAYSMVESNKRTLN
jgi:hypothetical protein